MSFATSLESHPLRRPILFLQGKEFGGQTVRITQAIKANEVIAEGCDRAILNGDEVSVSALPDTLATISSDVCRLVLGRTEVYSEFTLNFRIASDEDLRGIEEQFERTARESHLDTRAIEEFISATSRFGSAIGYCDGICAYLYGVLAKERAPDSSLTYEAYIGKYSKAAEELAAYDRPLAQTIGSLIEFRFNHFEEAAQLAGEARVGHAAARYGKFLQDLPLSSAQKCVSIQAPRDAFVKTGRLSRLSAGRYNRFPSYRGMQTIWSRS